MLVSEMLTSSFSVSVAGVEVMWHVTASISTCRVKKMKEYRLLQGKKKKYHDWWKSDIQELVNTVDLSGLVTSLPTPAILWFCLLSSIYIKRRPNVYNTAYIRVDVNRWMRVPCLFSITLLQLLQIDSYTKTGFEKESQKQYIPHNKSQAR